MFEQLKAKRFDVSSTDTCLFESSYLSLRTPLPHGLLPNSSITSMFYCRAVESHLPHALDGANVLALPVTAVGTTVVKTLRNWLKRTLIGNPRTGDPTRPSCCRRAAAKGKPQQWHIPGAPEDHVAVQPAHPSAAESKATRLILTVSSTGGHCKRRSLQPLNQCPLVTD